MAKTIQENQLVILAEQLSLIETQLENLLKQKEKLRSQAFDLLIEGSLNKCPTEYGTFTKCNGKTTKVFTCPKVKKAETALKNAKLRALKDELFEEKRGDDFLRFDSVQLN